MGLDSVELVMKIEKTFDISIPDKEVEKIITVGDFYDAVWKHVSGKQPTRCHSQRTFYKLRESFTRAFPYQKKDFVPEVSIDDIFPKRDRRFLYLQYADINALKLPELVLDRRWSAVLTTFGLIAILGGLITSLILINVFDYSKWTLLIPVIGMFLTNGFSTLLDPKRVVIESYSIRAFTEKILALNYADITKNEGSSRLEIESVINHIIAETSGVELMEISREKKIGDDLGIE